MSAADEPVVEHHVGAGPPADHEEGLAKLMNLRRRVSLEADLDAERIGQPTFREKLVEESLIHW